MVTAFLAIMLKQLAPTIESLATGGTFKEISGSQMSQLNISLPPIEIQKEIVSEVETEQALVNANLELITRFEGKIRATLARAWGGVDLIQSEG